MNSNQELLILDLDDTLVDTSHVYWTARTKFISTLVARGVEAKLLLELFEAQDEKNMHTMGFAPERYEKTMLDVYELLVTDLKIPREEFLEGELRQAGRILVEELPDVIDGAIALLAWARSRYKLVLFTRGTELLQRRKILSAGVGDYFDDIQIVEKKQAVDLLQLIDEQGFSPGDTWVIGDSIKSDINPALEVGAKAILYAYTHHSYYWRQEYGVVPRGNFYKVDALSEAVEILKNPTAHTPTTPKQWAQLLDQSSSL